MRATQCIHMMNNLGIDRGTWWQCPRTVQYSISTSGSTTAEACATAALGSFVDTRRGLPVDSCCLVPAFAGQRDAGGWGDAPTVQRIRAAPTVALTAAVQSKAVRSAALCAIRADEAVVYPPPPRAPLTAGRTRRQRRRAPSSLYSRYYLL